MSDVEITIKLPKELAQEARTLDLLSDAKIAELLQAEVDRFKHERAPSDTSNQLEDMASDPEIKRELSAIEHEFSAANFDGLSDSE